MEIVKLKASDCQYLVELQPAGWPDIVLIFQAYSQSHFYAPFKAVLEHKIVGVGTVIFHGDAAWLGHIIVDEKHRNKGIGKLLTQALIEYANNCNCETVYLLATDLGAIIYEQLGFEVEASYLLYDHLNDQVEWTLSEHIVPVQDVFIEQILGIDKEVTREDRHCSLEKHLTSGFIYENSGVIEGYFLPTLGEGLIIANSDQAGLELMKHRLRSTDKAIFPSDNLEAIQFMNKRGYEVTKTQKRMRLGKKRDVLFSNIYNRAAGKIG